jgi:integrase
MASVYKRKGKWVASFKGVDGWKARVAGTDKGEALRLANHWENEAKLRREGLVDPRADAFKAADARPIAEHVAEFGDDLKARGATVKHYTLTENRVRRVLALAGAEKIAELTPSRINGALKRLREGDAETRGMSKASALHYTRAIKMFSKWLHRDGRAREDMLFALKVGTVEKSERVHVRRALTQAEFAALVEAARIGPDCFGMGGPDRAMLYTLAGMTGLRAGELASLAPESFDLDACAVTVKAAYSKRRRDDRQPFPSKLVDLLRPWLSGRSKGARVFAMPPTQHLSEMIRTDLTAAGIPYADAEGSVCDFHSLRHCYVSWVVASGAPVSVCQSLARHSTPTLTFGVYAHPQLADACKAVESLPLSNPGESGASALRMLKTGTDDAPIDGRACQSQGGSAERALKGNGIFGPRMAQADTPTCGALGAPSMSISPNVYAGSINAHAGEMSERPEPDSNRRQTDLQSAPLDHSGIRPWFSDSSRPSLPFQGACSDPIMHPP